MKDLKTDISGNLIYKTPSKHTSTRFESSLDLKKIILNLHAGTHTGDIELDGSSVIVFNGVPKSSLISLIDLIENGTINEKHYTKEVI